MQHLLPYQHHVEIRNDNYIALTKLSVTERLQDMYEQQYKGINANLVLSSCLNTGQATSPFPLILLSH